MAVLANVGGWIADTLVSRDHAINWFLRSSLLPYTTQPRQDSCYGCTLHGMQSEFLGNWLSLDPSGKFQY
ncbi:hypothetical protein NC652_006724 [Populus alba x Populus x berolinensis]|nr:hypothetical protein NC652_006724 [Populus alba x Populus x berolinensis]